MSYIGQIGRAIELRIKEHKQDVIHNPIDKSIVAKHVNQNTKHNISFNEVKMLNKE